MAEAWTCNVKVIGSVLLALCWLSTETPALCKPATPASGKTASRGSKAVAKSKPARRAPAKSSPSTACAKKSATKGEGSSTTTANAARSQDTTTSRTAARGTSEAGKSLAASQARQAGADNKSATLPAAQARGPAATTTRVSNKEVSGVEASTLSTQADPTKARSVSAVQDDPSARASADLAHLASDGAQDKAPSATEEIAGQLKPEGHGLTASVTVQTVASAAGVAPSTGARSLSYVLYRYAGQPLRDSKWGKIAVFQAALSRALVACHQAGLEVDGVLAGGTRDGVLRLGSCPGFEAFALDQDNPLYGTVHSALWVKLLPNEPLPTVHERSFVLALTHEDTDYDQVEWNYDTPDRRSVLTWGPFGATVGHAMEVQSILAKVDEQHPRLLKATFGSEYGEVEHLIHHPADGYTSLKTVYADPDRRKLWKQKFETLGSESEIRQTYDWYALQADGWLKPVLQNMYDNFIPDERHHATEIDYAFFLDIAMQMSVSDSRIETVRTALSRYRKKWNRELTPPERRRIISLFLIPSQRKADRLGRNVVYYVDAVGASHLSQTESSAWEERSALRASSAGLSDARLYYPPSLD